MSLYYDIGVAILIYPESSRILLDDISVAVLRKLYLDRRIGGRHTSIDNVKKGFPKHLRGDIDDAVKRLIKQNFLLPKPTSYGMEVSLNPNMIPEIERILGAS